MPHFSPKNLAQNELWISAQNAKLPENKAWEESLEAVAEWSFLKFSQNTIQAKESAGSTRVESFAVWKALLMVLKTFSKNKLQ